MSQTHQPTVGFFTVLAAKTGVLVSLLCLSAIMWGSLRPYDRRADAFQICSEIPCIFGIVPGLTEWAEVLDKLNTLEVDNRANGNRIRVSQDSGITIVIIQSSDGKSVGQIYISFSRQSPLPVGWIVQRYGAPCGVSYYRENMLVLRYPELVVNTIPPNSLFDPLVPVSNIQFSDPHFHPEFIFDPCQDNESLGVSNQPWQGFYTSRHYHSSYSK